MDGNMTKASITKDLESMKKAGIGNLVFLEVNVGVPRGPVNFLSPQWQDLFKHAVRESERLDIEITLGIGPGWTGSGGPWVKPGAIYATTGIGGNKSSRGRKQYQTAHTTT
ncbi:glycosyl hydrolase [Mucilaginibacter humi]|uniref:glycosyl hydrolase n=1 Tax=Mucilaginibacter humi TaxID=2732510 RepID=UPI001C2E8B01|nr:glycosyl hydrolase [Mucilaginibacter humi]